MSSIAGRCCLHPATAPGRRHNRDNIVQFISPPTYIASIADRGATLENGQRYPTQIIITPYSPDDRPWRSSQHNVLLEIMAHKRHRSTYPPFRFHERQQRDTGCRPRTDRMHRASGSSARLAGRDDGQALVCAAQRGTPTRTAPMRYAFDWSKHRKLPPS